MCPADSDMGAKLSWWEEGGAADGHLVHLAHNLTPDTKSTQKGPQTSKERGKLSVFQGKGNTPSSQAKIPRVDTKSNIIKEISGLGFVRIRCVCSVKTLFRRKGEPQRDHLHIARPAGAGSWDTHGTLRTQGEESR